MRDPHALPDGLPQSELLSSCCEGRGGARGNGESQRGATSGQACGCAGVGVTEGGSVLYNYTGTHSLCR